MAAKAPQLTMREAFGAKGGKPSNLVLGFGDPESMQATFSAPVYTGRTGTELAGILVTAGFTDTSIERSEIDGHAMFWLLAR